MSELYFPALPLGNAALQPGAKHETPRRGEGCVVLGLSHFAVLEPRCASHRALIKNLRGEKALCPRESRARRFLVPSEGRAELVAGHFSERRINTRVAPAPTTKSLSTTGVVSKKLLLPG